MIVTMIYNQPVVGWCGVVWGVVGYFDGDPNSHIANGVEATEKEYWRKKIPEMKVSMHFLTSF